ncbi:methyltransferase [Ferrimonas pelagia]|uniref:Ribosomal RNA small subunit methyltransferase C n=1 Tax=Ferrimonas pelagia TaxID=1177826 RepID=A0ABP9EAW7_9GAMM
MTLTNPSRLVMKNTDLFTDCHLLLLNPDADLLLQELACVCASVTALTTDLMHYQRLSHSLPDNVTVHFAADLANVTLPALDVALIRLPKAREHLAYFTALAASVMPADGPILWVGDNKGGIRSAAKTAAPWCDNISKVASGAHCQMLHGINRAQKPWNLDDWWLNHTVPTPDGELILSSLPGVFGHGTLDQGTKLLLEHLPKIPQGRVLDFGCGDGIIGAFLAKRNPSIDLLMVDINAMALAASQRSANKAGVNAAVLASDGLSAVTGQFDLIVSNPPFHQGFDQTFDTARQFIRDAVKQLKPGGQLIIVANQHLPYGDDLNHAFGRVNIIGQDNKFKIYADRK